MNIRPARPILLLALFSAAAAQGQNAPAQPVEAPAPTAPRDTGRVDLAEVVAQVAVQTGREFVLDPRMPRVLIGDTPIEAVTYPQLLSILRVNGWFATEIDGRTVLMPSSNARSVATQLLQRDDPNVSDHEYVTRVIRVERSQRAAGGEGQPSNAAMLVPVLRPLIPVEGHLAAVGDDLIVVDRYDNVRRITAIVEALEP